jgi:hypothetical protein
LNRDDAVKVLKEVLDACSNEKPSYLNIVYLNIVSPNAANSLSAGYQVHIEANPANYAIRALEPVLQKHGLALKEEKERIVIYTPSTVL